MVSESFSSKYAPRFDTGRDEWVLKVPSSAVVRLSDDYYEIRLPIYSARALAVGGNILRPLRKKYRDWLLEQQGGRCAECGEGSDPNSQWNLDHQPALHRPGAKFIDYEGVTGNRVIHHRCDTAQNPKKSKE